MSGFLIVKNIHVDLGEFKIEDITFIVDEKDYVCVIGPTGSGKTILVETIAGLHKPRKGVIILDGRDITSLPPEKRNIGIVYQDYALFPHMTVFDNIAFGLKKRISKKDEILREVKAIAQRLEIEHLLHRKPTTLSGGEQQRVALARALIVRPKLLLMDEPFSALDFNTRTRLRKLVREVVSEYGTTVIHVTHDFEDVWSLARKVIVMYRGRILQYDTVEEVFNRPCCELVASFVDINVMSGIVVFSNDKTIVRVGDIEIVSKDRVCEGHRVKVFIRPERILISKSKPVSKFDNVVRGFIEDLERQGNILRVQVRIGSICLKCISTPNVLGSLDLELGSSVYICFRSSDVRLLVES
ncbi:MAG: ATP-binding cassette domain-containing protein [Crenarchaeota archaeon]|nr:ATP-binding cassette domain-containing protein [Thermoproteota archaeon]